MTTIQLIVSTDIHEGRPEMAGLAEEDTPLDLETAVWLPELCLRYVLPGATVPIRRPIFSERQLREAIDRGDLREERHGRSIIVTKRIIREWRESCRAGTRDPASDFHAPVFTERDPVCPILQNVTGDADGLNARLIPTGQIKASTIEDADAVVDMEVEARHALFPSVAERERAPLSVADARGRGRRCGVVPVPLLHHKRHLMPPYVRTV